MTLARALDVWYSYVWHFSMLRLHSLTHAINGNIKFCHKMPSCVSELAGHEFSRAVICVLCDEYLGQGAWRGTGKVKCISLLNRPKVLLRLQAKFTEFSLEQRCWGTSLCSGCVAVIYHPQDKSLHFQSQVKILKERRTDFSPRLYTPPCEREPAAACFLCAHREKFSQNRGTPVNRVIKYGSPELRDKDVGRPSKRLRASIRHNAYKGGGRPKISSLPPPTPVTSQDFYSMSHLLVFSLSDCVLKTPSVRGAMRVAQTLRSFDFKVEPHVRQSASQRTSIFEKYYKSFPPDKSFGQVDCRRLTPDCSESKGDDVLPCFSCRHPFVLCTDVGGFLTEYVRIRGRTLDQVGLVKIGIDSGGKSLKFMVQLLFEDDDLLTGRKEGGGGTWAAGKFVLDNGVSRVFIIALAPDLDEKYESLSFILKLLKLDTLSAIFRKAKLAVCVDLKMQMLILGLTGCNARFGCPYCLFSRWGKHSCPDDHRSILRLTAESNDLSKKLVERSQKYQRKMAPRTGENQSSTGQPPVDFLKNTKDIVAVVVPPQLHLVLGIVPPYLYRLRLLDPLLIRRWLQNAGISFNKAHGEVDLKGPMVLRLLRKLDMLEEMISPRVREKFASRESTGATRLRSSAQAPPEPGDKQVTPDTIIGCHLEILLICKTLAAFRVLMDMTMSRGADMTRDWQTPLRDFAFLVRRSRIKLTIKLHILVDGHLKDFLSEHAGGVSLAAWSEQAFESAHYAFEQVAQQQNVPKSFARHSPHAVLRAVVAWNSSRIVPSEYVTMFKSQGRGATISSTDSRNIEEGPQVNTLPDFPYCFRAFR